jgi:hypothetical protein
MKENRGRLALQRLLDDFRRLEDNEFWHTLWEWVENERVNLMERLARGETLPEDKLRYWQGGYAWIELFKDYPRRILEDTTQKIDE